MIDALLRPLSALAFCLGLAACAAPPGYWGTPTMPPASAYMNWDALQAYKGEPRVDYPGPAIHGITPDGGSFEGQ